MKLSIPAKRMIFLISIFTATFVLGGVILCFALKSLTVGDMLPISLGIILSATINVAKVFLLEHQVKKIVDMEDPGKVRLYATGQSLLRYALTGGGLAAAHFIPFTNLIAALVGAFAFNIAAYSLKFVKLEEESPVSPETESATDSSVDESGTVEE